MDKSNRREFIKNLAICGSVLGTAGGLPKTILSEESSGAVKINYRNLGSTGYKVSEVGFGAMNTRDKELIDAAVDAGINFIDTAHGYMGGENEKIVGEVLKTKRDKIFITTKVGRRSPDEIKSMIEISLKRLNTDHIDLLLLHGCSQRDQILNDDNMKVFDEARKKGQTRFVGFSTHNNHAECLDLAVESKFWQAVTVGYNHLSPVEVTESIKKARNAGIAIIAMKTQVKGKGFSGKTDSNTSSQQAALKWVLSNPDVDTTIPGMTSFEQLSEDLAVMGMKLTYNEQNQLNKSKTDLGRNYCRGVAGCTGCIEKCPKGVAVCEINRCLGYAYGYGNLDLAIENYLELPSSANLNVCNECSECAVKCVNGINLTANIKKARTLFG